MTARAHLENKNRRHDRTYLFSLLDTIDLTMVAAAAAACDVCGWAAAACSMLAFGSFGVPIKSKAAVAVDIDPLVFQSYKTGMCFLTAWLVLLAGVDFSFSPWGIVSGLFWVPGGVATVYAVKSAGLAIGIGVGSSFIVLVSFTWGILIFDEHVHSKAGAMFAVACMMMGLMGMSYYSSPEEEEQQGNNNHASVVETDEQSTADELDPLPTSDGDRTATTTSVTATTTRRPTRRKNNGLQYQGLESHEDNIQPAEMIEPKSNGVTHSQRTVSTKCSSDFSDPEHGHEDNDDKFDDEIPDDNDDNNSNEDDETQENRRLSGSEIEEHQHNEQSNDIVFTCWGVKINRRTSGILAAMFCGTWGGSILVPMKWSPSDDKGVHYLISFAIGATTVTLSLWVLRFLYYYFWIYERSATRAYAALPSFYIQTMWLPGGLSGLLWSIGNFFSLLSVYYLGEGVGYPLVQTAILVSGLWGIFYFHEVVGMERIIKWLCSSLLTIFGILLLSYEHHEK